MLCDVLHLDDCYHSLHSNNYRRCITELQKQRYRKQLHNIFTRRNTHIHQQICRFQKQFEIYKRRQPLLKRRAVKVRSTLSRAIIRDRENGAGTNMVSNNINTVKVATQPFRQITAVNILWQNGQPARQGAIFTKLSLQKSLAERKSQMLLQNCSKHNTVGSLITSSTLNTQHSLAMVGLKMQKTSANPNTNTNNNTNTNPVTHKKESLAERITHNIMPEQQELLYNPQEKENSRGGLPGIFRTKDAMVRLSSRNSLKQRRDSKQTCKQKLMQGLLYLQKVHKKASECQHILLGHKVAY